jgi:hypothetical protein
MKMGVPKWAYKNAWIANYVDKLFGILLHLCQTSGYRLLRLFICSLCVEISNYVGGVCYVEEICSHGCSQFFMNFFAQM